MKSKILIFTLSLLFFNFSFSLVSGQENQEPYENSIEADPEIDEDNSESKKPSFSGNFELTQTFVSVNESSRLNPDNSILDLPDSSGELEVNLELSDYFDKSENYKWLIKTFGYRLFEKDNNLNSQAEIFRIDEFYCDWSGEYFFLSVGKRRNSWGPALAFNPVNAVVPERDPLSPDQQTEGHPMFLVNYSDDLFTCDLILTKDYDSDFNGNYLRWGGKIGMVFSEYDCALYYYDGEEDENNLSFNTMYGLSFSGNFFSDSVFYIESALFSENRKNYYNDSLTVENRDEKVIKTAIGTNITLSGTSSLIIEYYHNTQGYSNRERENYFKTVDTIVSPVPDVSKFSVFDDFEFSAMNQNYILLSYRKTEILDKIEINVQSLIAEDSSFLSEFSTGINLSDFYKLNLDLKYLSGDKNSCFGNNNKNIELSVNISGNF